jgi:uncharacterized membrane protein YgcG
VREEVERFELANPNFRAHWPEKNAVERRHKADKETRGILTRGSLTIDAGEPVYPDDLGDAALLKLRTRLIAELSYNPFTVADGEVTSIECGDRLLKWLRLQLKLAESLAATHLGDCAGSSAASAVSYLCVAKNLRTLVLQLVSAADNFERLHPLAPVRERHVCVLDFAALLMEKWSGQETAARLGTGTEGGGHDIQLMAELEAKRTARPFSVDARRDERHADRRYELRRETEARPRHREDTTRRLTYDDAPPPPADRGQSGRGRGGGGGGGRGPAGGGRGGGAGRGKPVWQNPHAQLPNHDCAKHRAFRPDRDCERCYSAFPTDSSFWNDHDWRNDCRSGKAPQLRRRGGKEVVGDKRAHTPEKVLRPARRRFSKDSDPEDD